MAQTIIMQTDCLHVKKGGIELHVTNGKDKMGRLMVSNGTIKWYPKNAKKGIALTWEKFDKLMQSVKSK